MRLRDGKLYALVPADRLTEHDALRFGANAIVIGRHVTLNSGCDALALALWNRGYTVHQTDLSEFIKAGGAAKCLTLMLDHPT